MKQNKKSFLAQLTPDMRAHVRTEKQPTFIPPMLATLTENYFDRDAWLYEYKIDGIRCIASKRNGVVHLFSRNHLSLNDDYPHIVRALEKQAADNFVIDGEVAALDVAGTSSFQLLQRRALNATEVRIAYFIFDLLHVDGYNVRSLPLHVRKQLLKKVVRSTKLLVLLQPTVGKGIALFKAVCADFGEGVIAKDSMSPYVSKRSSAWLKFKCSQGQELVIGGYTSPRGSRAYFGALLVGYYKRGKLMYAGKVGTGYAEADLAFLGKKLQRLAVQKCPFSNYDLSTRDVHWVKPVLVGEFMFAEWTKGGKLRVGRYKGLRTDKAAKDIVRETPRSRVGRKKS